MEDSPNMLGNSDSDAEKHGGTPYIENNTKNNIEETEFTESPEENSFVANNSNAVELSKPEDTEEEGKNSLDNEANNESSNNGKCEIENKINENPEVWIETLTENGKSYYYHAISRETTWTKPEGPNIKIILQGTMESGDNKSLGSRMIFDNTNPMNIINRNQGPPGHNQHQQQQGNNQDFKTGPPQIQQKNAMVSPLFPPQSGFPLGVPGNFNGPPFSVPPPGYTGNHLHHPAPWGMPWNLPNKVVHHEQQSPKSLIIKPGVIDPSVIARAAEWSEHRAPDGRPYFYHSGRSESVWEKPQAFRDLEAARLAAHSGVPQNSVQVMPPKSTMVLQNSMPAPIIPEHTGFPLSETNINNIYEKPNESKKNKKKEPENEVIKTDPNENNSKTALSSKKPNVGPADKSRPVSSTPIVGTPWCVVWTGDNRVFFYNPSTRSSIWERPPELVDRADVDKAISTTPLKNHQSDSETEAVTSKESDSVTEIKKLQTEPEKRVEHEIPAKKAKIIELKISDKPNAADASKEAVIEAEVRASKERALVPLETRIRSFTEMLREKEVSAFSTWEKELHKIVFDPRYLLLTSRERKQIFEKYIKDRAEEERKEKRNKMRQKRESFRELMVSAHLYPKSSYSDFAQKYGREEKFRVIEKNKERESLFNEYIIEIRKKEREEKLHQKEMVKKKFMELLREKTDVTRHSRWVDVKKKIETDSRYRAVESSFFREEYFLDYCHLIRDEKRKYKDKGKDRDVKKKTTKEKRKSEENSTDRNSSVQKNETDNVPASGTTTKSDEENEKKQKDRDRQLRAEQSIKEREKEVQRSLANHLRDRDKEREHHKRDEAVRHFNALLADLVRNADLTWKEVKKQLKKDHRWELLENLERENRERIFNEHIESLIRKKRDNFREMLDESALELTCSWKDVKKTIKNDPRYLKYNHSDKCEREFRDYIKDKTLIAKSSLKELLQECKLITHKSFDSVQENSSHLKEIEEILKNDRRYLMLNHLEHERSQIILTFLEELHKKGPPPPPTATETTRRK